MLVREKGKHYASVSNISIMSIVHFIAHVMQYKFAL